MKAGYGRNYLLYIEATENIERQTNTLVLIFKMEFADNKEKKGIMPELSIKDWKSFPAFSSQQNTPLCFCICTIEYSISLNGATVCLPSIPYHENNCYSENETC